jgi:hypothetical protein
MINCTRLGVQVLIVTQIQGSNDSKGLRQGLGVGVEVLE